MGGGDGPVLPAPRLWKPKETAAQQAVRTTAEAAASAIRAEAERAAVADQADIPAEALTVLGEGEDVAVGRFALRAMATPGHTPGALSFLLRDPSQQGASEWRFLFSGETLLPGSFGRIDVPGADPAAMLRSLRKLATLPDHVRVCPGHHYSAKPYTTIRVERKKGYLAKSDFEWERATVYQKFHGTGHAYQWEEPPQSKQPGAASGASALSLTSAGGAAAAARADDDDDSDDGPAV